MAFRCNIKIENEIVSMIELVVKLKLSKVWGVYGLNVICESGRYPSIIGPYNRFGNQKRNLNPLVFRQREIYCTRRH